VILAHLQYPAMRLLTHNMLLCPRTKAYPLTLEATQVDDVEAEFSRDFILRMLPRLDWSVLRTAAAALKVPGLADALPEDPPTDDDTDDVLKAVHAALLEWHVVEGRLVSPQGHMYSISAGIPNLISADIIVSDTVADLSPEALEPASSGTTNDTQMVASADGDGG
jgi:multifunctional methyltransferase subunit TRM112